MKRQQPAIRTVCCCVNVSLFHLSLSPACGQKIKKVCIALYRKPIAELRSATCHIGSHSVTWHPTQVNAPRLNPSHAGRYSIYLPRRDGRLSWPWWLAIYRDGLPVHKQSPIQLGQVNHLQTLSPTAPSGSVNRCRFSRGSKSSSLSLSLCLSVFLCNHLTATLPGVELTTFWSCVKRSNSYATKPPLLRCLNFNTGTHREICWLAKIQKKAKKLCVV